MYRCAQSCSLLFTWLCAHIPHANHAMCSLVPHVNRENMIFPLPNSSVPPFDGIAPLQSACAELGTRHHSFLYVYCHPLLCPPEVYSTDTGMMAHDKYCLHSIEQDSYTLFTFDHSSGGGRTGPGLHRRGWQWPPPRPPARPWSQHPCTPRSAL